VSYFEDSMLPREKFFKMGIDALSNEELVSILIGSGIQGLDFSSLSRKVLKKLKSGNVSFKDLEDMKGLGEVKSIQILCSIELGRRIYAQKNEKVVVSNSEEAFKELRYLIKKKQEYLVCLFLNARYELLKKKIISIGTVDGLNISVRDIIVSALDLNAVYVILGHNHPSGTCSPSREDLIVTDNIMRGLDLVEIRLIDHIIVAEDGWESIPQQEACSKEGKDL